jgi:hypothetical protein
MRSRSFSLLQWDRLTNPGLSGRARDREEAVSNIVFDDEMGRVQREIAESHDLAVIPGYLVGRRAVSKEEGDASGRRISRPRSC